MRKRICVLLIFCLIPGLFSACFSSAGQANAFAQQLSQLENFVFTAESELRFADGIDTGHAPLRYVMEGTRSAETRQFTAVITYTDLTARSLFDLTLFEEAGAIYVQFVPLFQYLMDQEYADYDAHSVAEAFEMVPYLSYPALDLSNLLFDLPALLDTLDADTLENSLTEHNGAYTLRLSGSDLAGAAVPFENLTRPFGLFNDLSALVVDTDNFLSASNAPYTLDIHFSQDEITGVFTIHLTLVAPGYLTLTAEMTYREAKPALYAPPYPFVELSEVQAIMTEYHAAMERMVIAEYVAGRDEVETIINLPELHMVNHQLSTNLLEPFEMEIGDETFYVSVMTDSVTNAMGASVYSVSSAMTLHYTALEATRSARETMMTFIVIDLDVDDLDAENFTRSDVRVNAHNTAAVKALHFDDNLVGRALHIYVLQNLPETDEALFLRVVVIMDNMTRQGRNVLERLGFYIGLDFVTYLDWAEEAESNTEPEEPEND